MAFRKSEDEKKQAAADKAKKAFLASPVGLARTAFSNGDMFFQVEIAHSKIKNNILSDAGRHANVQHANGGTDTLGEIVREGWHLISSGWVYVETGQESRDKFLSSGQQVVTRGEVVGIYLFERAK